MRYLCFGEYRLYGLFKPRQTVHAEEQHILHSAVMQVAQHSQPESARFVCPDGNAQNLFVTLCCHTRHNIGCAASYPPILTDFVIDAVHEYKWIYRVQWAGLPFLDLGEDLVRNFADHFY